MPASAAAQQQKGLVNLGSAANFAEEIREIASTLAIFEGFSNQESDVLCEYMECFGAPTHTTILDEGDSGDFMLIVLTGAIDVVKAYGATDHKIVAHVSPGGVVGEMSLIDGQHRFASCITTQPTDFAILTRNALNEILIDHPRLGNKFLLILLQLMTSRLRDATTRMLPTIVGDSV
jgi:CRP-like cAMP-binding protein